MKHPFTLISCWAVLFLWGMAPTAKAQTGGADITVNPVADQSNRSARVSVAFDGSIYVGRLFSTVPGTAYDDHWELLKSTDKGATFEQQTTGFAGAGVHFTAFDILTAGTNATDFRLFVAAATKDPATGTAQLMVTGYNYAGELEFVPLEGSTYTQSNSTRGYESIALATDARDPNSVAVPYSISVVAAKGYLPNDSVLAWVSGNGLSAPFRRGVYGTSGYIRSVSASLGSAPAIVSPYGRLGIAWDEVEGAFDQWGTVHLMYVYGDDGGTVTNGGPYQIGNTPDYRQPCIALSQNTSSGTDIRTVIAYEYNFPGQGVNSYAGVSNSIMSGAATFSDNISVGLGPGGQINPYVMYDVINDTYLITYYDSASNTLRYQQKTLGSPADEDPVIIIPNYRAATNAMAPPYPRIDMGTIQNKAVFVWNDDRSTMFDAEISYVSIQENTLNLQNLALYPNPAQEHITLTFNSTGNDNLNLRVLDMTGKVLYSSNAQAVAGNNQLNLTLPNLAAGQYLLLVQGRQTNGTVSFLIHR